MEFASLNARSEPCSCSVDSPCNDEIDDDELYMPNFDPVKYCLPEVEDLQIRRLVEEYKEIFRVRPGRTDLCEYHIRLQDGYTC